MQGTASSREGGPHHRRPPPDARGSRTVLRSRGRECRTFPARPRVAIYPAVVPGGGPASLGGAVRFSVLLALVSATSLAAPSFSSESAGTLGRPDLASPSRVHTLVQLDARRVLAIDAAGLARVWDVSDWQQLGVASLGTHALIGPGGLGLPGNRSGGCLLAAPVAATRDGRLVTAEGQALRLCGPTGRRATSRCPEWTAPPRSRSHRTAPPRSAPRPKGTSSSSPSMAGR